MAVSRKVRWKAVGLALLVSFITAVILFLYAIIRNGDYSNYLFYTSLAYMIFSLVFAVGVSTNSNDGALKSGEFMVINKISSDEAYQRTFSNNGNKIAWIMFPAGLLLFFLSVLSDKLL